MIWDHKSFFGIQLRKNAQKSQFVKQVIENKTVFLLKRKTTLVVDNKRGCFVVDKQLLTTTTFSQCLLPAVFRNDMRSEHYSYHVIKNILVLDKFEL